jgi:outer membrane protein assembly factor BamB
MRRGRLVRWVVAPAAALALVAVLGVIGYRVLAPHETLIRPREPYPDGGPIDDERPFSELRAAPLVVDGRLRVYAEKWRVWSDGPVGGRYEATPYWVYRRWPAQVVGVVAVDAEGGPLIVSQWSDGQLVALDARRGELAWRVAGPGVGRGYDGRRTGASVVYEPESLLTVHAPGGDIVVASGFGRLRAFDAATGAQRWDRALQTGCVPAVWTGDSVVAIPACASVDVMFVDAATGAPRATWRPPAAPSPVQCALGRSGCRVLTSSGSTWLVGPDGEPTPMPDLPGGGLLVGDRVVYPTASGVAARPLQGGPPQWTWNGQGELLATSPSNVYLLTEDRTVLALDPETGALELVGCAAATPGEQWRLGHVYPTEGTPYIALERLTSAGPEAEDQRYFYGARPIALVELYPPSRLPIWPGKFAACRPL